MPPAQGPPVVVVADEDVDDDRRKTHIEVSVRLRPLLVNTQESSSSFLDTSALKRTSARKPQIPRAPTSSLKKPSQKIKATTTTPKPKKSNDDDADTSIYAWDVVSNDTVRQSPATDVIPGRTHSYTVDHVYAPHVTTEHVYQNSVLDLVHAAMDGYHTSVLAYGQTSTGKTHTMTGTSSQPGLIPLCVQECFDYLARQSSSPREYLLRISYLEVYKEHIQDLLAPSNNKTTAPPVRLFDSSDGLVIKGLQERVVTSPQQVYQILAQGEARRQVGATHLNQHSSRSHVMVRLWIESKSCCTTTTSSSARTTTTTSSTMSSASSLSSDRTAGGGVRVSTLSLVDLAGSESVRLSGSNERRQEGHYINKSLMTLGQVVYALSEGKDSKKHVPYRDSKLTRLLQPSLSGNAQVVLICCISPLVSHLEESHNTFKFATRAKKIPQKATIQEVVDDKTLLQSYREEIEDLKQQLKEAREQQEQLMKETSHSTSTTLSATDEEVELLVKSIQNMEKLILKSKPPRPEDLLDSASDDEEYEEESLLAFASCENSTTTPPSRGTSSHDVDDDLHKELARVQGLLGSVLKKRMSQPSQDEVKSLRAQLEQQEVATSLRQADSSFLQAQLEEKDALLREVSKVLEAVEERQQQLEAENAALRQELDAFKLRN